MSAAFGNPKTLEGGGVNHSTLYSPHGLLLSEQNPGGKRRAPKLAGGSRSSQTTATVEFA